MLYFFAKMSVYADIHALKSNYQHLHRVYSSAQSFHHGCNRSGSPHVGQLINESICVEDNIWLARERGMRNLLPSMNQSISDEENTSLAREMDTRNFLPCGMTHGPFNLNVQEVSVCLALSSVCVCGGGVCISVRPVTGNDAPYWEAYSFMLVKNDVTP